MAYDHTKQYRAIIVRGKALGDLDDLLPLYASIIAEIAPIDEKTFSDEFNLRLEARLTGSTKKTLDNHRTEIAGKLFGLFYPGWLGQACSSRSQVVGDRRPASLFQGAMSQVSIPLGDEQDRPNSCSDAEPKDWCPSVLVFY